MNRFRASLFIAHREAIPHDGSRLLLAGGRVERRDEGARAADDALTGELAGALPVDPGEQVIRDAGLEAWHRHQQRGDDE